jgi:hypothetical protein
MFVRWLWIRASWTGRSRPLSLRLCRPRRSFIRLDLQKPESKDLRARLVPDLAEAGGGVAEPEAGGPAIRERIQVGRDRPRIQ